MSAETMQQKDDEISRLLAANKYTVDLCTQALDSVRDMEMEIAALKKKIESDAPLSKPVQPEPDDGFVMSELNQVDYETIMALGRILAAISITVKGEEAALKRHSYHDLPELVVKMAIELEMYRAVCNLWDHKNDSKRSGLYAGPEHALQWF